MLKFKITVSLYHLKKLINLTFAEENIRETIISIVWQLLLGDSSKYIFLYQVPTDYKLLLLILT